MADTGESALHAALCTTNRQAHDAVVKVLLGKGANPQIADANGRKPIDLVGSGAPAAGRAGAPAAGRGGGRGDGQAAAANVAEIRALLENAASGK